MVSLLISKGLFSYMFLAVICPIVSNIISSERNFTIFIFEGCFHGEHDFIDPVMLRHANRFCRLPPDENPVCDYYFADGGITP